MKCCLCNKEIRSGEPIYDNFNFNKWELVIQCW